MITKQAEDWEVTQAEKIQNSLRDKVRWATPPRYKNAEVDSDELFEALKGIKGGKTDGLLLTGPTGVGKTHAAFASLMWLSQNVLWLREPRVEAVSVPDMLARCRPGADPIYTESWPVEPDRAHDPVDWYSRAGLLLLDDLGAEKASEWTGEVLYRIIDQRYTHMLTTIVVSNLPPAELAKQIGDRLASRLTQMCRTVVIKGADRRRQ